jgi:hypothetical protein
MSIRKGFKYILFSRMKDLIELPLPEKLREITYVANCTNFRSILLQKYGKPDLDIDHEIATKPDTKLTYLGYRRFLESDLKHIFALGKDRSSNSYKRDVKYLAKQMLIRGYVGTARLLFVPLFTSVCDLQLTIHSTGIRWSGQKRLPGLPTPINPRVDRRTQGVHEFAQHQNGLYNTMALWCRFIGKWRVG